MYSFELNIGSLSSPSKGGGYIEVNPILEDNGIVKYRDDKFFAVIRKRLSKELIFKSNEYTALKQLYDNDVFSVEIKIYANSIQKFYGNLLLFGEWDENKNRCSLNTEVIDKYSELQKNMDTEVNIISYNNNSIKLFYTSILIEITLPCFHGGRAQAEFFYDPNGDISADPLTAHSDWAYYEDDGSIFCGEAGTYRYKSKSTYLLFPYTGYVQSVLNPSQYLKKSLTVNDVFFTFTNAAKLFDILRALLNDADNNIFISESTYSDYINDASNKISNMFIMDKSDAKRNDASNPATYEILKLKRLLELYSDWFGLSYFIDDSSNFKLAKSYELMQVSYISHPQHNLTTYKNKNFTNNQKNYTIDLSRKVDKVIFTFEDHNRALFPKSELVFDIFIDNKKEWNYAEFNNDIDYLRVDPDDISDTGFTMFSCDSLNVIINQNSITGSDTKNGAMTAQNILYNHHRENAPFKTGILDGVAVNLEKEFDKDGKYSNMPIRDIDDIDFDYYILTDLGLVIPIEFEIKFAKGFGNLKFKVTDVTPV